MLQPLHQLEAEWLIPEFFTHRIGSCIAKASNLDKSKSVYINLVDESFLQTIGVQAYCRQIIFQINSLLILFTALLLMKKL